MTLKYEISLGKDTVWIQRKYKRTRTRTDTLEEQLSCRQTEKGDTWKEKEENRMSLVRTFLVLKRLHQKKLPSRPVWTHSAYLTNILIFFFHKSALISTLFFMS